MGTRCGSTATKPVSPRRVKEKTVRGPPRPDREEPVRNDGRTFRPECTVFPFLSPVLTLTPAMSRISRFESMQAIPCPAVMERKELDNGGVRLTVSVPTRPLQRKLLRLPEFVKRDFELDSFGKQILDWCDGRRNMQELLDLFVQTHRVNQAESEKAVLTFIRTLVGKNVLVLMMPQADRENPESR